MKIITLNISQKSRRKRDETFFRGDLVNRCCGGATQMSRAAKKLDSHIIAQLGRFSIAINVDKASVHARISLDGQSYLTVMSRAMSASVRTSAAQVITMLLDTL